MTAGPPDRSALVTAATVGTAHRAVDVAGLPEAIRPDPVPAEAALAVLDAAALSALTARTAAPTLPPPSGPPIAPCACDRPIVPDVVRQVLGRLGQHPAVLVEALTLIGAAGLRLPPALVPAYLDDTRAEVVAAARPVTGSIGDLLMRKNPRWAPPRPPDPADRSVWDEGTTGERRRWLRAARRADPAGARDLLAEGFAGENPATRADLLATLGERLSPADQDFLLGVVGDRSRAVVAVALDLLTRLPDSPLRRDMRALVGRHLTVGRRPLRSTVTLADLRAEDFSPWPAPEGNPWTTLLGRVDPAEWSQLVGVDLARCVEDLPPLTQGFRQAAITFRHCDLARLLVRRQLDGNDPKVPATVDPELWAVLAPADAPDLVDRMLADRRIRPDQVSSALTALPRPWSTPLARRVARALPALGGGRTNAAPRSLWDLWATASALPDCREFATLARSLAADATGDTASASTTRASQAATVLTVRAVLFETLSPAGGMT